MQNSMTLRHQNFMWAVRKELGWPSFAPANDCIAFASGRTMDFEVGLDLARHAQSGRKDFIYSGWASADAKEPDGFVIALRELLTVDVISNVFVWAADDTAPIIAVSTKADEHFAVGARGILERRAGKPKSLARGKKLAMKRIRRTAASMGDELCPNNSFVPNGAEWTPPEQPLEIIANFR